MNKSELIQKIAQHVRTGIIEGIADLADESDRKGMRIVIQLKKDAHRDVVLNQLFKHTNMQSTFGVNNIALVGTQPKLLSLKDMMSEYLKFREEVVVRRTEFELRKAEARAHILEGYRIALDNIDEIVDAHQAETRTAPPRASASWSASDSARSRPRRFSTCDCSA